MSLGFGGVSKLFHKMKFIYIRFTVSVFKINFLFFFLLDCAYGYDYDRTYYDRTPITEHDWICDKGFRETNIFVYNRFGELIGTFIFGQLGDT